MAESDTILQLGIDAAREGNREEARNLFGLLTRQEPNNLQAWLWLAGVADGPEERRVALERVLELDPTNEMAAKGLQAMGVTPGARSEERESLSRAATMPAAAAMPATGATMTDEERYAAELDSAFDDYDSVPRAEAPVRSESDLELEAGSARAATERRAASRAGSRERSAARRATTPVRSGGDDDMESNRQQGTPRWVWLGAAVVGLIFALILLYRSSQPTTTGGGVAGGGAQPTQTQVTEGDGAAGANISPTEELTSTGITTPTETFTPTTALTPTAALPPTPATPSPPSTAALSQAKPQPVDTGTQLEANGWGFTFPGICSGSCATVFGPQIGSFNAQGTYVVVLVLVGNNTNKDQPLPANYFVLKDDQGRIYNAQPQVSSAYVQRGVNADIGMEDAVPANGLPTSVPLVFDVNHGATNLVLFATGKTDQGWKLLDSVP